LSLLLLKILFDPSNINSSLFPLERTLKKLFEILNNKILDEVWKEDEVIGTVIGTDEKTLLTITENGYGKRTKISEYRLISRGGSGVRNIICSERNGKVVEIKSVSDDDDIMLISKQGIAIRTNAAGISAVIQSAFAR